MWKPLFQGMRLKILQADKFKSGGVGCFQDSGAPTSCSSASSERVTQTHHLWPGFEPRKTPFRMRRDQVIAVGHGRVRNSRVATTQTVCRPTSSGPVRQ